MKRPGSKLPHFRRRNTLPDELPDPAGALDVDFGSNGSIMAVAGLELRLGFGTAARLASAPAGSPR